MDAEFRRTLATLNLWALGFCALTLLARMAWLFVDTPFGKAIPAAATALAGTPMLLGQAAWFLAAYCLLHLALATAWHFTWLPLGARLEADSSRRHNLAVLSFLPLLFWLLLANARWYPESFYAAEVTSIAAETAVNMLFILVNLYLAAVVVVSAWLWTNRALPALLAHRERAAVVSGVAITIAMLAVLRAGLDSYGDDIDRERPDLLLVGVDSLRIDHIGYQAGSGPSLTPALDRLLSESTIVEDAWTPLGRTFPAWTSILTGRYPTGHGARYNLTHRDRVDDSGSLPHRLDALDYQRVYATDETRFSNMDESYGFDTLVAPAIGAFDFLVGTTSDLPMVNLVGNTALGGVIFPFVHMNRALPVSYRPAVFDRSLRRAIESLDPDRPLFLVTHFELPHWPYTWSRHAGFRYETPAALEAKSAATYRAAVARADRQVQSLVDALDAAGRLDNAVLVLLSDHGEAFRGSEPGWGAHADTPRVEFDIAGHGSNVFSEAQNRILLAFRGYGREQPRVQPRTVRNLTASLVDVSPTLHEWIGMRHDAPVDGVSLLEVLAGTDAPRLQGRVVSVETGFSLPSIEAGVPDAVELARQSADYYDVARDGRLSMQEDWAGHLLHSQKQRAVLSGRWMLGALPVDEADAWRLVLADRVRREYWDARDGGSLPPEAPVQLLHDELCKRFERPAEFRHAVCRGADLDQ